VRAIADLIVRFADLVEAEGRTLRAATREEGERLRGAVGRMAVGLALVATAVPLLCAGACLVATGLVLWLEGPLGPAGAVVVAGLATLGAGAGCLWIFKQTNR
jgi:hypothetical protein